MHGTNVKIIDTALSLRSRRPYIS